MLRICLLGILLMTTACSEQLKDYVRSRPDELIPQTPVLSNDLPNQRISAGAGGSSGPQVASQFVLNPSQRQVSGSQVRSTISFSQR